VLINRLRAHAYMRRYELDVLIATSPVNVTYCSDYYCWIDRLVTKYMTTPGSSSHLDNRSFAVFPLEGDPALVVTPIFAVNAGGLWVNDLQIFGEPGLDGVFRTSSVPEEQQPLLDLLLARRKRPATAVEALTTLLQARGLAGARIGLEMEGMDPSAREALSQALPQAAIRNCSNLIRLIRMVKSAEEIECLTRAAEINEVTAVESLSLARPGRSMSELIHHFRVRVAEMDADFDHFAFGIRGLGIATEPHYVLKDDDILYVDFGCVFRHYFSDGGTTLALREPPIELLKRHAALRSCIDAGVEVLRPGVRSSVVRDEMWSVLNEHGITASFPHGHGLGLEVRDYPILVANNGLRILDDCVDEPSDLPLEPNMVINLESAIFMPGVGSLHIEKSFVVTPGGNRPLIPQDRTTPFEVQLT